MGPGTCRMRTKPSRSGSVAVFAGHAFGDCKGATALLRRGVKPVAGEAFLGFLGLRIQLKDARHTFADLTGQRLVGAAVLVLKDPGRILILQDAASGDWLNASVAPRGGTRSRANVFNGLLFLSGQRAGGSELQ